MKKATFLLIFIFLIAFNRGYTCSNLIKIDSTEFVKEGYLKGLRKANAKDIDPSKKIRLDGVTVPVYTIDGNKVQGMEMMQLLVSGDFLPEQYINEEKEVKAFVLRKATEQEKKRSLERKQSMKPIEESIRKEAKSFKVKDLEGNKFSLKELKGKVIVMNFWFIGCKPCIMEMPELNKLVEKYKGKSVVFLGFTNDEEEQLISFLKKRTFLYNIIPDSKYVTDEYNINSFPTHIIIDSNSKIAYSSTGLSQETVTNLDKIIESLIEKKF